MSHLEGERWDLFCAVPEGARSILDVGCGSGKGFQSFRSAGVRLTGVDLDADSVARARSYLDDARTHNIERDPWPNDFQHAFEVVAFADCLEHLVDPWAALASVKPLLSPGGVVIASIPNARQIRVVTKLLLGRWDYVRAGGTVQRDHVRFFTRKTIIDMFTEAGYQEPKFFFPKETFHLSSLERTLNRVTLGVGSDLLYGSYTVQAAPKA
jgi:2-polyprenyl-3-methyl-5-hydroxy-6-metoxy-1,4-benzoquinol methylase